MRLRVACPLKFCRIRMDWQRTSSRHPGVQCAVIAILLACLMTTIPSLQTVQLRTLHASAMPVDVPQSRIPTTRAASRSIVPISGALGEDVNRRDRTDRQVTSSRVPRKSDSRPLPASAPAAPARGQSQILRI